MRAVRREWGEGAEAVTIDVEGDICDRADPGGEGVADSAPASGTRAGRAAGHPEDHGPDGPHGLRAQPGEAITSAWAGACRRPASRPPRRSRRRGTPRCSPRRRGAGAGGPRGNVGGPRARHEHEALAAVRAQLRVLLRGPLARRRAGRGMVDGIQGTGVGTSLKHYAANNQETDRLRVDAEVDERTLREIYLPAFERVVKAASRGRSCAPTTRSTASTPRRPLAATDGAARRVGVRGPRRVRLGCGLRPGRGAAAGLDLEMPPPLRRSPDAVVEAVRPGGADEASSTPGSARCSSWSTRAGACSSWRGLRRRRAPRAGAGGGGASGVLLKNEASCCRSPAGAGSPSSASSPGRPASRAPAAPGQPDPARQRPRRAARRVSARSPSRPGFGIGDDDDDDGAAGRGGRAARRRRPSSSSSGCRPRTSPRASTAPTWTCRPTSSRAPRSPRSTRASSSCSSTARPCCSATSSRTPTALLEAWLGGQAAGGAIADVLLGAVNPSGRLAETIPLRLEDNSSYLNFPGDSQVVRYGEGLFIGYRGYDKADLASPSRSASGCPTRPSSCPTSRSRPRGRSAEGDLAAR